MNLLISANMYHTGELDRIFRFTDLFPGKVGVEVFPLFHEDGYEEELQECVPRLGELTVSFHGPYYRTEHSAPRGTDLYEHSMELVDKTLVYSRILNSRYVVFHHNNCRVTPETRDAMIQISCENYHEIQELFAQEGIPVVVENAGVKDAGNMLFDQEEFIGLCKKENYRVLVDIGHAFANGWDLVHVMEELKDQIVSYHLHNNDGRHDSHRRIHDGRMNFDAFMESYRRLTPNADLTIEYHPSVSSDEMGIAEDIRSILEAV